MKTLRTIFSLLTGLGLGANTPTIMTAISQSNTITLTKATTNNDYFLTNEEKIVIYQGKKNQQGLGA